MAVNDHDYFHQRAEAELEQAQQATHAKAVAAHHQMAEAYRARASSLATSDAVEHQPS